MPTLTLATATTEQIEEMHQVRRFLLAYAREVSYAAHDGWKTQSRPGPDEAYLPEEEFFDWLVSLGHFG